MTKDLAHTKPQYLRFPLNPDFSPVSELKIQTEEYKGRGNILRAAAGKKTKHISLLFPSQDARRCCYSIPRPIYMSVQPMHACST